MHPNVADLPAAAELLQVHPRTVTAWVKEGRIPGAKIGGQWRFWRPALLSAMGATAAPETDPAILTPHELAEWLGIHPVTITALLRSGEIPAVKAGLRWRIAWQPIEHLLCAYQNMD